MSYKNKINFNYFNNLFCIKKIINNFIKILYIKINKY